VSVDVYLVYMDLDNVSGCLHGYVSGFVSGCEFCNVFGDVYVDVSVV